MARSTINTVSRVGDLTKGFSVRFLCVVCCIQFYISIDIYRFRSKNPRRADTNIRFKKKKFLSIPSPAMVALRAVEELSLCLISCPCLCRIEISLFIPALRAVYADRWHDNAFLFTQNSPSFLSAEFFRSNNLHFPFFSIAAPCAAK